MEFEIKVTDGNSEWVENYDKDTNDPKVWAIDIIKQFNKNLNSGEKPRKLLDVVIKGQGSNFHKWVKNTYGMSVSFRGSTADLFTCSKCGITGKRYGLRATVERDSKFKAKKYKQCIE